jgi:hypothetical protein
VSELERIHNGKERRVKEEGKVELKAVTPV